MIRLRRPHQTWKISTRLGRPPDSKDLKGPRVHVRFFHFYSCHFQSLMVQFVFLLPLE
ncbi:hypothetical protein MtrunA17_Chr3g0083291 [Medicago truncatula]|uniref:Uncharacterized protein n=1 Tax=Medicago truncatula TaxID=3880 RepID=A0A396IPC7_MEDTR|nr:hypothetical protein MtrunA17_Chr3g0083291 [Medicago truncatula]